MVADHPDGAAAILEALVERGHDVTLLTNFAPDTFALARARWPVLGKGRGVTVSGEVRLVKPDPAIYEHHARTFGLDPGATLFIDDSPKNVEAARRAGWQAVEYVGAAQLRRDLARYGIEV